jgi:hypothetical protein
MSNVRACARSVNARYLALARVLALAAQRSRSGLPLMNVRSFRAAVKKEIRHVQN